MRNQSLLKKIMALTTALVFWVAAIPGRVGAAATTGLTPEQIEAAVEEHLAALSSLDVSRYVNGFAANAVVEDPVGSPPIQGTQAIAASYTQSVAMFSQIKMRAEEIIVCGDEAATRWNAHLTTTTGKKFKIGGIGIYKFDQAGKLILVREFFDVEEFLAHLQN